MTRFLAPVLAAIIAAGAVFALAGVLDAFPAYRGAPEVLGVFPTLAGLSLLAATIICLVLAARRKPLAFAWVLAPVSGALLAAGYYAPTAPYCRGCNDAATYPIAAPWVFGVAGTCVLTGAITARWPRAGMVATALTMLGAVTLGLVIGYHTLS